MKLFDEASPPPPLLPPPKLDTHTVNFELIHDWAAVCKSIITLIVHRTSEMIQQITYVSQRCRLPCTAYE